MLITSIQLYGQTSPINEKGRFYSVNQLKAIAHRMVEASLCDSILFYRTIELQYKDSMIISQQRDISLLKRAARYSETLLTQTNELNEILSSQNEAFAKKVKRQARINRPLVIISVGLGIALVATKL